MRDNPKLRIVIQSRSFGVPFVAPVCGIRSPDGAIGTSLQLSSFRPLGFRRHPETSDDDSMLGARYSMLGARYSVLGARCCRIGLPIPVQLLDRNVYRGKPTV